jgi:hypothetical protein
MRVRVLFLTLVWFCFVVMAYTAQWPAHSLGSQAQLTLSQLLSRLNLATLYIDPVLHIVHVLAK